MGIIFGSNVQMDGGLYYLSGSFLFGLIILVWLQKKTNSSISYLFLHFVLLFISGVLIIWINQDKLSPYSLNRFEFTNQIFAGEIISQPKIKNSVSFYLKINAHLAEGEKSEYCTGNIIVYAEKDSVSQQLNSGQIIQIKGKLYPLKHNTNPHSFDFASYLSLEKIYHSIYASTGKIVTVDKDQSSGISQFPVLAKNRIIGVFEKHFENKDFRSILSAMIMGDKTIISDDLYNQFSETGSLHLLAVSGLHVGIILLLFTQLFGFLQLDKILKKQFKQILLITIVWLYALMTGAAPAVLRASFMFSVYLISKMFDKEINIYNLISFSAFVLLCYNPLLLFKPGFQFSFLALLSIVYFHPKIYKLFLHKNQIVDKIWSLFVVALSAQILIFPISVYYFNSFSLYFWLSGILLVPFTGVIIVLGLLLVLFELIFPVLCTLVTWLLAKTLSLFVSTLSFIQSLPGCSQEGLFLKPLEFYLLMTSIVILILASKRSMISLVNLFLLCLIGWTIKDITYLRNEKKHHKVCFYDLKQGLSLDLFFNRTCYSLTTNINPEQLEYASKNNRLFHRVSELKLLNPIEPYQDEFIRINNGLIQFRESNIFIICDTTKYIPKVKIDYLVLTQNAIRDLDSIVNLTSPTMLILDKSNRLKTVQGAVNIGLKYEFKVHNIYDSGAICLDL
jgi:competence protein ComEC